MDLEEFLLSTLPENDTLKERSAWFIYHPIFNAVLESIEKPGKTDELHCTSLVKKLTVDVVHGVRETAGSSYEGGELL